MLSQAIHTDIPSIFFVSKEVIQKRLTRMFVAEVFIMMVLVYMFFSYSNSSFMIIAIAISPSTARAILSNIFWIKKYREVEEKMPYIIIEDDCIYHFDNKHFAKIQIANIAGIELKKVFWGPKYLEIRFKERVIDDRSLIPAHHKWMHWNWIRGDDQIKCRWFLFFRTNETIENIAHYINLHLDKYNCKPQIVCKIKQHK